MKNLLLLILFFTISSNSIYSQKFKAGVIIPNKEFKLCCVYTPGSELKIYNKPNGKIQGKIYLGEADNNKELYTAFIEKNGLGKKLEYPNLEMVGYETMALIFVDSVSEFVKLKNGFWISTKELKSKNLRLIFWMDYAIEKTQNGMLIKTD